MTTTEKDQVLTEAKRRATEIVHRAIAEGKLELFTGDDGKEYVFARFPSKEDHNRR